MYKINKQLQAHVAHPSTLETATLLLRNFPKLQFSRVSDVVRSVCDFGGNKQFTSRAYHLSHAKVNFF